MAISEISGQGLRQFLELSLASLPSAPIGLEGEIRRKSAGLRTYTVVGTAAALFLLISKYGFTDVLVKDLVVLDPSRVAAQIVRSQGCRSRPSRRRTGITIEFCLATAKTFKRKRWKRTDGGSR